MDFWMSFTRLPAVFSQKNPRKPWFLNVSGDLIIIEATRFELAASASRTRRSTKLSHASICICYCEPIARSRCYLTSYSQKRQALFCCFTVFQHALKWKSNFHSMGSKVEITLSVTSTSEKWKFLLQNHRSRCTKCFSWIYNESYPAPVWKAGVWYEQFLFAFNTAGQNHYRCRDLQWLLKDRYRRYDWKGQVHGRKRNPASSVSEI